MPSATLPTFSLKVIEAKHSSEKSCYVRMGAKVFDMTEFLPSHPGGDDLVLQYAGKDVTKILADEMSHSHSESAYEILEESLVGFLTTEAQAAKGGLPDVEVINSGKSDLASAVAHSDDTPANTPNPMTGMSSAEELSIPTDLQKDYKTHKFIDLNKPMLMQVFNGGFSKKFYLEQVHRPRHYKGGESAPLFGNFLEPLSKTPWWVVPTLWLPAVAFGAWKGDSGLDNHVITAACFTLGICIWTLVEYVLHRCLFHLDGHLPDNRVAITLHFLLHGIHHYLPMDKLRLVMPPTLFVALATPFWKVAHSIFFFNWYMGTAAYSGGIFGYICYDLTHYFLHHRNLPSYYKELKKYHLQHHFADYENGFGVTSRFWDRVFGTELPPLVQKTT